MQACVGETLFLDQLLPGRDVTHPLLQPSPFPKVLTSPLAPAWPGLHSDLARQDCGATAPAAGCDGRAPSLGLRRVTACLSVTRPVTVNTLSTMHVGVQAPPLPTQIQAAF